MGPRFRRLWVVILTVAACGDDPTGPDAAELVLEPALSTVTALDVRTMFRVRAFDATGREVDPPDGVHLRITEQARVLAALPVVEVGSGSEVSVLSRGPGEVRIHAVAGSLQSNPAIVVVRPTTPIIAGTSGNDGPFVPGDPVELAGYLLDGVTSLTLGGEPVEVLEADSAVLRFAIPPAYGADCTGAGAPRVESQDAVLPEPVSVRMVREDEIVLRPGEWKILGDAAEQCVRIAPDASSRYTLAYLDARPLLDGMSGAEGRFWTDSVFDLRAADATRAGLPALRQALPSAGMDAAFGDLPHAQGPRLAPPPPPGAPDDALWRRSKPWKIGDKVSVESPSDAQEYVSATIVRNYRDRIVVAVLDSDAQYRAAERLDSLDQLMGSVFEDQIPLFQSTFGAGFPVTAGSGQLLMFIGDYRSVAGAALCDVAHRQDDLPSSCAVVLSTRVADNLDAPLDLGAHLVAHELAHTWQVLAGDRRCRDEGDCQGGIGYTWAGEGGADFVAMEALRLKQRRPFDLNGSWFDYSGQIPPFGGHTSLASIRFGFGYGSSEWFFRHLVWRAMEAGASYEEAMKAVLLGSLEGWNGYYLYGHFEPQSFMFLTGRRAQSLTSRLRSIHGPGWHPLDAFLEGVTAFAVDDLTPNPRLQNPSIERIWAVSFDQPPTLQIGEGSIVEGFAPGWAFGWLRIEDPGVGASLRITTSAPEGVYRVLVAM